MVIITADKKFIDYLKVNRICAVTVDVADKARIIHEKVGNNSAMI